MALQEGSRGRLLFTMLDYRASTDSSTPIDLSLVASLSVHLIHRDVQLEVVPTVLDAPNGLAYYDVDPTELLAGSWQAIGDADGFLSKPKRFKVPSTPGVAGILAA